MNPKTCQSYLQFADGSIKQCRRKGWRRKVRNKECCICDQHLQLVFGLPDLNLTSEKCKRLLTQLVGGWDRNITGAIKHAIRTEIRQLSLRSQQAIVARFGFDSHEPRTYQQCGEILGVTRERVRQMEGKAIRQLRHPTRLAGWLRRYYMDNREFLAGQVVTIYEDPITETTPEGTAVLVSLIERSVTGAAERWWVQFLDDDFHNQVERTIKVKGGK